MDERSIFLAALEKELPPEREAYLDRACGGDSALRSRVDALLRAHDDAGSFLERPPAAVAVEDSSPNAADERTIRTDATLEFLGPPAQPGHLGTLGPYQILEVVGQGGMGVVLKGQDPRLNRVVAIKVLLPELASNVAARKRFLREAQAAAAVSHDHVVTIHAIDEDRGLPYLVMEFVAGISLQEKLDRTGPLQLAEILRIGMQTASGLAAAHAQGLIHRDIKPANILLENGIERVKITDFGLARAVDDVGMTRTGVVAGTPQYMSPEQARGEFVDHRSDLFSLGCVLYALCTGRPPFRAESTIAVLRRICDETPRPIAQVNPDIPRWLADIVDRLLAKDPQRRIQSAAEVAEVLGRRLAEYQQSPAARGATAAPSRLSRFRRRPATVAIAALCLLAGLGLTEATGITQFVPSVIRIVNGEGTLVIEINDPGVNVTIDGESLVITGAGPNELRLSPGSHHVYADKEGRPVHDEVVTVTRGGEQVVSIRVEPTAGDANAGVARLRELAMLLRVTTSGTSEREAVVRELEQLVRTSSAVQWAVRDDLRQFGVELPEDAAPSGLVASLEQVVDRLQSETVARQPAFPEAEGPARTIAAFDVKSHSELLAADVEVDEAKQAWKVTTDETRVVRLFEVGDPDVESAMLTYRATLKTEAVDGRAYLEMWVRLPGLGESFSKGFHIAVSGTHDWSSYEIPFYLMAGQNPDLVLLNLVIEGSGTVWIQDVELLQTPLKPSSEAPVATEADATVVDELRRLIELKSENFARITARHAQGIATESDVNRIETDLVEARLRLADAERNEAQALDFLQRLVELASEELERTRALVEAGILTAGEVNEAEQRLVEARLRWQRARDGRPSR